MLWWVVQNLVVASALALLMRMACLIRRIDPVARHALWLIVLIKLMTPPLIAWPWPVVRGWHKDAPERAPRVVVRHDRTEPAKAPAPAGTTRRRAEVVPIGTAAEEVIGAGVQSRPVEVPTIVQPELVQSEPARAIESDTSAEPMAAQWPARLLHAAALTWISGSLAFTAIQFLRIGRMIRRVSRSPAAGESLDRRVALLCDRLQIRPIAVRVVAGIRSPAIWAVARPTLLWPAELRHDMPVEAIDGLIVHELAHARRRDHWVGWMELLAGCVWWWNPLFWYVRQQVRENAELACDAWVVDTIPKARRAYAEALLAVCEQLQGQSVPAPAVGVRTGGRQFLERRLAMILQERFPLRLGRNRLIGALVLTLTSLPAWSQKAPDKTSPATSAAPADPQGKPLSVAPIQQDRALPPEAAELLSRMQAYHETAQQEMDAKVASQREIVIAKLTAAAAKGTAEQAAIIREAIADLTATPDDRVNIADLKVQQDMAEAAKLQIEAAQADLAVKEIELNRAREMFEKQVIGEIELRRIELDVKIGKVRAELATQEWIQKKDEILAAQARIYQKKRQSLNQKSPGRIPVNGSGNP
jgi:beta-lactamase regulating signal transducer with metallopeptidase domain